MKNKIFLKKVSVHNLKEVDLTLNPFELIVFTGVSGSGKSSLAFDTLFVEGQRRYLSLLPQYARHVLGEFPKPEAEMISGVSPTLAVEQKSLGNNPRSTVATVTGIYDFLRILFAKLAIPYCPVSKTPVLSQTKEQIFQEIRKRTEKKEGAYFVFSPYARKKKGSFQNEFSDLLAEGFSRVRADGVVLELAQEPALDPKTLHDVDILVDRWMPQEDFSSRVLETLSLSLEKGNGSFSLYSEKDQSEKVFSLAAYCPESQISYPKLEPVDFSFNHPAGMCERCHGLGEILEFNLSSIIDEDKSISEDCCEIASSYKTVRYKNIYENLARLFHFDLNTPWKNLSQKAKKIFLYGLSEKWIEMQFVHPIKKSTWTEFVQWQGVLQEAHQRYQAAQSEAYKKNMRKKMSQMRCSSCQGSRLKPYPAAAQFCGKTISEISLFDVKESLDFFKQISLLPEENEVAREILDEMIKRLSFLQNLGLSYLTLNREVLTLSGGEAQRVKIASQLGSGLSGMLYVLDEPSIGLHPFDQERLIQTLYSLRDLGNTILVVEHDFETILAADTLVDFGPKAGTFGGRIVAQGNISDLIQAPESLTGKYLSGKLSIFDPRQQKISSSQGKICMEGIVHRNLNIPSLEIPLNLLVCVTGVSGSGKSSLISETLYPLLSNALHRTSLPAGACKKFEGSEHVERVLFVDQSPIGKTSRSNLATYIQLFDEIRELFASLPESKARGFGKEYFSFNLDVGSCLYCKGKGQLKIDMDFMEDSWIECSYCEGKRFEKEILAIHFKEKNIFDVLDMEVHVARKFFSAVPAIAKRLEFLEKVGLDYLKLGQPSPTLSGGEAQRIKLARELSLPSLKKTLYILDEPTTGLHFYDVQNLLKIFRDLIDQGHSVLVIEHHMDFIKNADWILDLGPGAGSLGGKLVDVGTPKEIAKKNTPTGIALKKSFAAKNFETGKKKTHKKKQLCTEITITNARQHNLKNLDIKIPHQQISVLTGPSGAGKSSLAFDTIYTEGQRKYLESFPAYVRQFFPQKEKAQVDKIEGLFPPLAIEQKNQVVNPRSTLGTLTEIHDLFRVLFAHLGVPHCPETGERIEQITKEKIVEKVFSTFSQDDKFQVLAPIARQKNENFQAVLERLRKEGFLRVRWKDTEYDLDEKIPEDPLCKEEIFLVVDRLKGEQNFRKRLLEALDLAEKLSKGKILILGEEKKLFFQLGFSVVKTGKSYPPITPQTFSFNSEQGMCPECHGLGTVYGMTLSPLVYEQTIEEIFSSLFSNLKLLNTCFSKLGINTRTPLKKLSKEEVKVFLYGTSSEIWIQKVSFRWKGLCFVLEKAAKQGGFWVRKALLPFMEEKVCPECKQARIHALARKVTIQKHSIFEVEQWSLHKTKNFLKGLSIGEKSFLKPVIEQIEQKLSFLCEIDLGYLSLNRSTMTLSGGELQRALLAKQLAVGLTSCTYIFDEPTTGLHPLHCDLLFEALTKLKNLGNTLLLVEQNPRILLKADHLIELGPSCGALGGNIIAEGSFETVCAQKNSLTKKYFKDKEDFFQQKKKFTSFLSIEKASLYNLKNLSVRIPLHAMTCIVGVSGAGKSTLLNRILKPLIQEHFSLRETSDEKASSLGKISGLSHFDELIVFGRGTLSFTERSDVGTYTEIFPLIRSFFASLKPAQAKGLQPAHFSYNHLKGMCKTCWGLGSIEVDLQFLPPTKILCHACQGGRLGPLGLEIVYKGKNVKDILSMTLLEIADFFSAFPRILKRLKPLFELGLGSIPLGQTMQTLAKGEAQRVCLAKECAKKSKGRTLYLLDEPTRGLHPVDLVKVFQMFQNLVDQKNTIILIDHHMDLVRRADFIIELGPKGGDEGGKVVCTGTPSEIRKNPKSLIASYF